MNVFTSKTAEKHAKDENQCYYIKKKKKVFLWKGRRDLSKRVAEGSDTAVKGNYLSFQ